MNSQGLFETNHLTVGECIKSEATPFNPDLSSKSEDYKTVPVIIEVMEYQVESQKLRLRSYQNLVD